MACASRTRQRSTPTVSSPHWRRVLNAALGPEPIDAATDAKLGTRPHIALEHLTVIADVFDNAHHPVLGQPELLAEIALDTQQAPDFRLVRLQRLVDITGGDAELLGVEHGIERPLDGVE